MYEGNNSRVRIPPRSFLPGEMKTFLERTTIKKHSTRGSEVECTISKERTARRERTIQTKHRAVIRGLINPVRCYRWEGELNPKCTYFVLVDEGETSELLSQR